MSTKALTKVAAKQNLNDPSLLTALRNGGPKVLLSCIIMGLGNILAGQVIKGLIFLLIEIGIIVYLSAFSLVIKNFISSDKKLLRRKATTADENTHSDEEIILEAQRKPDERGRE